MKYCFYLVAFFTLCLTAVGCSPAVNEECCPVEDVESDTLRSSSLSEYIIIEDIVISRATGEEYIIIEDLIINRVVHGDYIIIEDIVIGYQKNNPEYARLFRVDTLTGEAEHYESMNAVTPNIFDATEYIIIEDVLIGRMNGNEFVEEKDFIIITDINGI